MSMLDPNSINMSGYAIQELSVGQKASFSKTILASDIYNFAGIIGDFNPVHVNAEYAKTTRFGSQIAHGMLTASLYLPYWAWPFLERMRFSWSRT